MMSETGRGAMIYQEGPRRKAWREQVLPGHAVNLFIIVNLFVVTMSIINTEAEIYQKYRVLGGIGEKQFPIMNSTSDQEARTRDQVSEGDAINERKSRMGRSVEYNSPIKRILELIGHHTQPVIVIASDNRNEQPPADQQRTAPASAITGANPITGATASSDNQQQWTLIGHPTQVGNIEAVPLLATQQQQLIQTSLPYEQYFVATNNMMSNQQQQQPQQFAMIPPFASPAQMVTYDRQQPQPQVPYLPTNIDPEQIGRQANNMGESVQPIFLSSYEPGLNIPQPPQPLAPQQQQPQQQQQYAQTTVSSSQPHSIQQIQQSQQTDAKEPDQSLTASPEQSESPEDESHADEEPSEPSEPANEDRDTSGPHTEATSDQTMTSNGLVKVGLNDDCMQCICRASSGCDQQLRCITRGSEEKYCGPFQLTEEYWNMAGSPEDSSTNFSSFEDCANDVDCAVTTVTNYMKKHHTDCDGDKNITCLDYARLHRLKPNDCGDTERLINYFDSYWARFQSCAEGYDRSRDGEDEFI